MLTEDFMRSVFEIAFGADAADREFTREDVLQRLREFSDAALVNEEPAKSYDNCTVAIWDVTYYLTDEDGEDVLNEDGSIKLFKDTNGAVDYSTWCEHVEADLLEEINE